MLQEMQRKRVMIITTAAKLVIYRACYIVAWYSLQRIGSKLICTDIYNCMVSDTACYIVPWIDSTVFFFGYRPEVFTAAVAAVLVVAGGCGCCMDCTTFFSGNARASGQTSKNEKAKNKKIFQNAKITIDIGLLICYYSIVISKPINYIAVRTS